MVSETIEVKGHIIDSLILPKVMDEIMDSDGSFEILEIQIGQEKTQPSRALLRVEAPTQQRLEDLLRRLSRLGAVPLESQDAQLFRAARNGVFPEEFYATTNLPTSVRLKGRWRRVSRIEMDCGIVVDRRRCRAECVPMYRVKRGQWVVCGHDGVRVSPLERARTRDVFQFMGSAVSSERPKARIVGDLAAEMRRMKKDGERILVVGGPAIIHTGGGPYLERLIRNGYVQVLFAGNGLATHDIEAALFETALGIDLVKGVAAKDGHDHHLRAINTIRACGGIRQAVRSGRLTRGVMHSCVTGKIPFVLAGSIRDDGPLPEVVTDVLVAQERMRKHIRGLGLALIISSMLHGIATGNILPATVKTVCVDINPAVVTKLADRGTFQGVGIVSDAASFLRELSAALRV